MSAPARAARVPFDPGISLKATTLEAALGLLGAAISVVFDRGQDLPAEAADAIEALALPAGLRSRRTMLDGEWWRDGRDPMVARVAERRRAPREPGTAFESPSLASGTGWVALIPVPDGYAMRAIGLDGAPVEWPVDARTAERLSPFAFAFHRCFERKALGARDVLRFALGPAQGDLGLLLSAGVGAALVGLLAPMATGWLVDHAIPSHAYGTIVLVLAGLGVAGLALVALDMLRTLAELRFEARAGVAMQAAIVDRVVSAPPAFFRAFSSGDLGMRIGAVNAVQRTLTGSAIGIFTTTLFLAANVAMMFTYSAALSLAALAVVAIVVGVSTRLGLERARIGPRIETLEGKVAAMTFELFAGIAKLRAGAAEGRALERWYSKYEELREASGGAARIANRETVLLAMLQPLATALVLSLAWHAMRGPAALTAGHFVAFHAALFGVLGAVQALVSAGLALAQLKPIWDRARPILEVLPENAAGGARHEPQGAIALEGVSFAYPGAEPALRGIDLAVQPGEFVAVVGPSGSGKSTLMRLLLGFEKPASGTVRYDGHDLAQLDAPWLRRRMGTVLQDGRLWAGDLYSNIAGAGNAGVDAAWAAARRAGIAAEIDALPMGMYTVVGEGLATLSGGQRQRVLVARALVSEPRILLLDEATSALDGPAQAAVMESLAQLGATRIVIAHRLDTVRAADRIVVLERGRIVQQGTFRELAQRQGPFAALLARQVA